MQEFDHPNILRLIGVCLDGGPAPYIIMPFMTNGSLLSHLKENRDSLVVDPNTSDHEESDVVGDLDYTGGAVMSNWLCLKQPDR